MDAARWDRVQDLFHQVADLAAAERLALLAASCPDDPTLIDEVENLVRAEARGATLLDRDVAQVARAVLGDGIPSTLLDQRFGPYRITQLLGEGGMGVVYRGVRDDLDSVAAIKILRDAWLSPGRRERFAAEQRTLARLEHPSIARLYDADTLPDGTPWFAMEFVEGVPLTTYCDTLRLPLEERLRLFRAVCEAVTHAHRHLVIHRDLKPSNILVRPDGSVKLLDFGIAKQLPGDHSPADQTRTGLRLMTPAYAAPEQLRGEPTGVHSDVYSLGVVLYQLLTGRLPFDLATLTPGQAEEFILTRDPERPSLAARQTGLARAAGRRAWADLDVLCLTAMQKDPERRYHTVEALVRDVDHFLSGEPLEARPDSVRYRLGKFVRRNWQAVSLAAAVLLVVVGLVVFYTVRLTTARNAALAEASRAGRIQQFTMNLFQGGDKDVAPADSLRVTTLLERGVQEARSLGAEPAMQAELYQTLGTIYQQLGRLERADTLLRAALDRRRTLLGTENADVARSLVALGLLRADQAEFAEAEKLVKEGLATSRRVQPGDHPDIAAATASLGHVLELRGQYDSAITTYEEAVRRYAAQGKTTPELAGSLYGLANNHFYAGHYAAADLLTRQVLAMSREMYGERHPNVAEDLINLGAVQFESGRYAEAEKYDREALAITEAWYGRDHPETASAMTLLARAVVRQQRNDEALALLRQAVAIQERVYGKVHPRVASALNEIAIAAMQQGKLDEAEAGFRRMVAIYDSVYAGKHYLIGIAKSNVASVLMLRKDYAGAERLFRAALAMFGETLPSDHSNVGITSIKLGRALLRQRKFEEAAQWSSAGYQILVGQVDPGVSWLVNARKDLVAAYDTLGQPEKGAKYRRELADTAKGK